MILEKSESKIFSERKINKKMKFISISELRNIAFSKLIKDKSKFSQCDIEKINNLIYNVRYESLVYPGIISQINRDIRIYKKWDAICMWLDADSGLARYEPSMIRKITIKLGGL